MKKLLLVVVALAVIAIPMTSFAGIATSAHDLRTSALDANNNGLRLNLCMSCHLPHNAQSGVDRLWAAGAGTEGTADLCESCHDGTIVVLGGNVFTQESAHIYADGRAGSADKTGCSGDGTYCHDVHEQGTAAGGGGKFLAGITAAYSDCGTCHNGTAMSAGTAYPGGTDKSGVGNHALGTDGCGMCHVTGPGGSVHGTPTGTVVAQTSGETVAGEWLLPVDNNATGNWGGACVGCHETNIAAYSGTYVGETGGTLGTFENIAFASSTRHNTSGQTWGTAMGGCNDCHYVHNGGADRDMYQLVDNTNSASCKDCHDGTPGPNYQTTGSTHPTDVAFTTIGAFPTGSAIDDDGINGVDYSANAANILCETCHSVHRNGIGDPFLRSANSAANEICTTCHAN